MWTPRSVKRGVRCRQAWSTVRLLDGLHDLVAHAHDLPPTPDARIPDPADLRLRQVTLPRGAFFGEVEQVPADRALGRICAAMLTPSGPGGTCPPR